MRRGWLRIFSWIGIARIAVADHLSDHDGRAVYDMAEPLSPRPVVADASEGRDHVPIAGRLGLMEHGLVEARTPTPRLVHDERRQIVAYGIGMPALLAIRRRVQRRARVRRAVNEDDRPLTARLWDLELHVGLSDRDLLGITGGRTCSVFRDLGYAADEQ